eukprot:TRINITY_DN67750_c3_g1_i1.p1 TRINITY_DN67750_c3_g1~~TRINITY_DN67750_c3_g1_i1.p1  ORF type:complete len:200 (+),score=50.18 TRINITY_DN67750_c3_g1_i1:42-641(+)
MQIRVMAVPVNATEPPSLCTVEVQQTDKISAFADHVESNLKIAKAQQRLLLKGKLLDMNKTVEECKITEKDTLISQQARVTQSPQQQQQQQAEPAITANFLEQIFNDLAGDAPAPTGGGGPAALQQQLQQAFGGGGGGGQQQQQQPRPADVQVSPEALAHLLEMGLAGEAVARQALQMTNNDIDAAANWILEQGAMETD